jgi:multiple sugar transport system substrate-binding protein
MTFKTWRIAYIVLLASIAGCANIASLLSSPTPAPIAQATATPQTLLTPTVPSAVETHTLTVWLPPRFDPNANTTAGHLLKQRLTDFQSTHPKLAIDIRIKAENGEASLLNSLNLTNLAAPMALPDLIALTRPDLEFAALKGLLHPVDGLSTMLHDPNWYGYAHDLGNVQNIGYGLPFAAQQLVLIHQPELQSNTWNDILTAKQAVLFPAGDPQALIPLALYISAGGKLMNDQNLPVLEEGPLTKTLSLLQNGLESQTFSTSLLNLKTDDQVVQAYRSGRAKAMITWSANYQLTDGVVQLVPGLQDGSAVNVANGWMWALAGSAPENQQVATELAEYLLEDKFLSQWINMTGYMPTRIFKSSQADPELQSVQIIPSNDVMAVLGPIMNQAVSRVLNGEQVPVVVRSVMELVK